MLESVADTISPPDTVNWSHSSGEIADGVDDFFASLNPQAAQEQKDEDEKWRDLMEAAEQTIKAVALIVGEDAEPPITAGVAMLALELFAISDGDRQAAEDIRLKRASDGFMEGVVLGVFRETLDVVHDRFWEDVPEVDYAEAFRKLAQTYYNGGLALGYVQGTTISLRGLVPAFMLDLKKQVGDEPLGDPDPQNPGSNEWVDFYIAAGAAFSRGHIAR